MARLQWSKRRPASPMATPRRTLQSMAQAPTLEITVVNENRLMHAKAAVIDKKVAALSSHSSQVEWIEDIDKLLREWSASTADTLGIADTASHVEAFTKIQTH